MYRITAKDCQDDNCPLVAADADTVLLQGYAATALELGDTPAGEVRISVPRETFEHLVTTHMER